MMPTLKLLALTTGLVGCAFDPSGLSPRDGARQGDSSDRGLPDAPPDGGALDHRIGDRLLADRPRGDGGMPDVKPSADVSAPPDVQPPPDVKPPPDADPCAGLTCPLGCNVAGRCNRLAASNGQAAVLAAYALVTSGLTVSSTAPTQINTDNGSIYIGLTQVRPAYQKGVAAGIYWDKVAQGTGQRDLSVFVMTSLSIAAGRELRLTGSLPAVLYVTGSAVIDGRIVAPVNVSTPGAGGYAGGGPESDAAFCFGGEGRGGWHSDYEDSGGSGGGRKASGGKGGDGGDEVGLSGGKANGSPSLTPLYGGCGGGGGGGDFGGEGGGGGGALHLAVNGTLTVSATGVISMPGAGGQNPTFNHGGGGGGSGGAIFLEASALTVVGTVAANGGGGGGGGGGGTDGAPGSDGTAGGSGGSAGSSGAVGGKGGGQNPEAGAAGGDASYNAAGGGGGAGRIRLAAKTLSAPGVISPAADQSTTVSVW